eukprot:5851973-Ditylum_brightwellii.AAC.1
MICEDVTDAESGKSQRSVSVSAKVVKASEGLVVPHFPSFWFRRQCFTLVFLRILAAKHFFIVIHHIVQSDSGGRLCAGKDSVVQTVVLP